MRIGLITGEFPPMQGGVGDYTRELARALAALGVEVHIITSTNSRTLSVSSFSLHASIRRWSFLSLLQIRSLARSLRLDLLNVQYQAAAYDLTAPIHFLPDMAGVKTVATFHDLRVPYLLPKAGRLREWTVTHLARSAAGAIAVDAADADELRRRGVRRVTQIPIGSNIPAAPPADYDRAAWRARIGVLPQDFLLGYFGFLNPSKGGDTLIGALAALKDRQARAKLVLIGDQAGTSDAQGNTAFAAEIEKMIARYDLSDRIIRTGFVSPPEVSAYLLACDAVVLPYRDGVSFRRGSFMAALVHGCAVITTHPAAPLPELQEGVNVRLVPPESASAIVLAVTALLEAPELRARLGRGARALARQFEWDSIAARTLEFFRAV